MAQERHSTQTVVHLRRGDRHRLDQVSIRFEGKGRPKDTGAAEIKWILTHLAVVSGNVAVSAQNQVASACMIDSEHHSYIEVN